MTHTVKHKRSQKYLFISFALFLFLSTILYKSWATKDACFCQDSYGYDIIARNFIKNNILIDTQHPSGVPIQPVGYPFLLGIIYKLFGPENFVILIFLQILAGLLSIYLIFAIANWLFGIHVANIATLLASINIGILVFPQTLLAETLQLLFILFAIERLIAFATTKSYLAIILSGLTLGLSILLKPSALILFFFIVPLILLLKIPFNKKLYGALLFTLCFATPVLTYMARNKVIHGYFHLSPLMSLNLYHVFLSKVIEQVKGIPESEALKEIPEFNRPNRFDERGWDGARKVFWQYAPKYPFICVYVWMKNVAKTLFGLYSTQMKILLSSNFKGGDLSFFREPGGILQKACNYMFKGTNSYTVKTIALLETLWTIFRYIMILIAFLMLLYMGEYWLIIIFTIFIASFSLITGFDGCCRYRILFEPLLLMLTAFGIVGSYKMYLHGRKGLSAGAFPLPFENSGGSAGYGGHVAK